MSIEKNPDLMKSRYGFNIVFEARISTLVRLTQKYHPELTKQDLMNFFEGVLNKYWNQEDQS